MHMRFFKNSMAPLAYTNSLQAMANNYLKERGEIECISAVALTFETNDLNKTTSVYSGFTDNTKQHPVNSTQLYQIGSITKSFTAAILLQLEAALQHHFTIEMTVGDFFPELNAWGSVTIQQLLNMTSGIPDYLANDQYLKLLSDEPDRYWSAEEQIQFVANLPLKFKPGTQWDYSNTNYILAGLIISKITGNSVEEEMNKRFLGKNNSSQLNLTNTYYISHQYPSAIAPRMVHGYKHGGTIGKYLADKTDISDFSLSYAGAAGAIVSNAEDIIIWIRALLGANQILPEKQLNKLKTYVSTVTGQPMTKPNVDDPNAFGLGIGFTYVDEQIGLIYNYEGMTLGFRAQYIFPQNTNRIISATTNSSTDSEQDELSGLLGQVYESVMMEKILNEFHEIKEDQHTEVSVQQDNEKTQSYCTIF